MEGKTQETAAAKAGMSVRSARKWQSGPLPSQAKPEHRWRTRPDPFDGVWEDEIEPLLRNDPTGKLKATTIIDWLAEQHPGRFSASQLRTRPVALLSSITQRHNYSGQRGYHPLLAVAAGTGEVLMARLRKGRANTARGAAHFLRETVGRVRHAGATGPLTVRADSGFYTYAIVAVCRDKDVRFSITVRHRPRLRNLIEAIPEEDWTPIPYWMEGAADVAETTYVPFESKPDAAPVRLMVRRVKPTPGSQLALFTSYSYHAFITDRDGDTLDLEADHRRHAEIENAIRDLKYG